MDNRQIREALDQLDGTAESAMKLLAETWGITLTDEDIEALGGMPDERRRMESTENQ